MGDKQRSEIQKPVKNTLLSGASHGFPFENFQGSSLLIPVSQDSPSVLNDSASDVNKLPSSNLTPQNVTQVPEAVGTTVLGDTMKTSPEEQKSSYQSTSQGYSGIFSSLFGSGNQKKQEGDLGQQQRKNSDHTSPSSISSSPRSSSPFVTIPNIQSFSPALQVPSVAPEPQPNEQPMKSVGFSHSVDSPFSQIPNQPYQHSFDATPSSIDKSFDSSSFQKIDLTNPEVAKPQRELQNFFSGEGKTDFNIQNSTSNIGFESFYGNLPSTTSSGPVLSKAQSALELPVGNSSAPTPDQPPLFFNQAPQPPAPHFYQTRSGSADSFKPIQSPSLAMAPPMSSAAPPLSTGITSNNYRRDHHKRLAYAPVPGLTSHTTVSSSYLQPCNNFGNASSLSTSAITPPPQSQPPLKQPLVGSVSQPALKISAGGSDNESFIPQQTPSSNSLQSFFNSNTSSNISTMYQPIVGFTTSDSVSSIPPSENESMFSAPVSFTQPSTVPPPIPTAASTAPPPPPPSQIPTAASTAPPPPPQVPSAPSAVPLPPPQQVSPAHVVSSAAVQPPIMSAKELPVLPTNDRASPQIVLPPSFNNLANMGSSGIIYRPVYHHWFHKTEVKDSKEMWQPFSMTDSLALEQAFNSDSLTPNTVVATDGGRYDVNVTQRIRRAVYWEQEQTTVRRCSWFYRSTTESRLHPYDENTAFHLEEEYKKAVTTNTWHRKVDLNSGEYVIMYGPNSMALFQNAPQTPEGWEAEPDYSQTVSQRSKIVKRGVLDDFEIEEGESVQVDHLIFVVHGIGKFCDFKFRTIEEAGSNKQYAQNAMIPGQLDSESEVNLLDYLKAGKVDGFRAKALQLIKSHFRSSIETGAVNRVEVLPVSWHTHLHGETTGVDKKLQTITLKSIPKLRSITNDTLLDILFYTSPVYCENIVQQVGREITTLFGKFKSRNPSFRGGVSLVGHSLGSLILFDMLCHQKPFSTRMENIKEEAKAKVSEVEHEVGTVLSADKKKRSLSRNVSYVMGPAGTGQPYIEYPQLSFQPVAFFALGSPIGMFVTVRGIDSLGLDFCFPTCSRFFNVFHPFDPVAYRIEALINPELAEKRPVLIPHHKGRKRMHLELKETMGRVSASLKQRLVDSIRSTWNTVYHLTMFGRADDGLEEEVDKVIERQLERQRTESINTDVEETEFNAGKLNMGRRIDYVLQEAPLESVYEYFSAVLSHVIYWGSDDTILLILKEIYESMGISPDNQQTGISGIQEDSSSPSPSFPDPSNMPSTSSSFAYPPNYGFK